MNRRTYDTPAAFKRALEDRLKSASSSGEALARRRQLLVFDRFLARVAAAFGEAVMLKGGLVLELRLERARTTKDVDLRLAGPSNDVLPRLQVAGALDLGDFMRFEVAQDPDTPEIVGDGIQYDGYRFRAECRLAGKIYGARFGVDVVFGGVLSGDVEEMVTEDVLGFAGIPPPRLETIARKRGETIAGTAIAAKRPSMRRVVCSPPLSVAAPSASWAPSRLEIKRPSRIPNGSLLAAPEPRGIQEAGACKVPRCSSVKIATTAGP